MKTITLRKIKTWPDKHEHSQEQIELAPNERVVGMNTVVNNGVYFTVLAIEAAELTGEPPVVTPRGDA